MSSDRRNLVDSFWQMIRADDETITLPKMTADLDVVMDLLSNQRRRVLIHCVSQAEDGEMALGDVAERVAAIENGIEVDEVSSDQRKRAYVGLYQTHAPKLDDRGVIYHNDTTLASTPVTEDWAQWVRVLEEATGGDIQ